MEILVQDFRILLRKIFFGESGCKHIIIYFLIDYIDGF